MAAIKYWLWLAAQSNVSPRSKAALIAHYGSAEEAFFAPSGAFARLPGLSERDAALLEARDLPDIEYLAAGHHGSKTSTSAELLDALKPETVCISVGSNSYGHPARETLRRLGERGCAVCRTDLHGNIHLSLN